LERASVATWDPWTVTPKVLKMAVRTVGSLAGPSVVQWEAYTVSEPVWESRSDGQTVEPSDAKMVALRVVH
jgi:hypothetical protein